MKKYFYLILLIFVVPFIVLADAAGPYIISYDAIIINKNGIKYTDFDNKEVIIPYNSKVRVIWDSYDSVTVSYIDKNKNEITTSISKKDIIPLEEEINPNNYKSNDNEQNILYKEKKSIIVFSKNGLKLRKGPSEIWGEYDDVIDYMTMLDTSYSMYGETIHDKSYNLWYYVDNGKYHGWVDTSNIGYKLDSKILTFSSVKLKNDLGNEILTIPAETILDEIYLIEGQNKFYVKYNFEQGFIDLNYYDEKKEKEIHVFDYGVEVSDCVFAKKDIKMTSLDGKTRENIPFGTKINVIYALMESEPAVLEAVNGNFYVEYNNKKGFVKESDVFTTYYDESQNKFNSKEFTLTHDVILYSYDDKKPLLTINENSDIYSPYCFINYYQDSDTEEEWCVVKHDNQYGYIMINKKVDGIDVVNNSNDSITLKPKLKGILVNNYHLDFESRKYQYTLKIKDEVNLDINIIKEVESDEIEIIGNENLKDGSIIKVLVKRDDKSSTYYINITKDSFIKANSMLLYCILGAVILSVIVIVVILLINKNKKTKGSSNIKEYNINEDSLKNSDEAKKQVNENDELKTSEANNVTNENKEKVKKINVKNNKVKSHNKNITKNSDNIKNYKRKRKQGKKNEI